jgi:hypothetical protein
MEQGDVAGKMPICRGILIIGRWSDVVSERESVVCWEEGIEKALITTYHQFRHSPKIPSNVMPLSARVLSA